MINTPLHTLALVWMAMATLTALPGCSDSSSGSDSESETTADTGDPTPDTTSEGPEDTDEGSSEDTSEDTSDTAEDTADGIDSDVEPDAPTATRCETSEDCAESQEGNLCSETGTCTSCVEDEVCEGDYGPGAVCNDDGRCACPEGTEGCSCNPDEACEGDLVCTDGVCASPANPCEAMPGDLGCPCDPGACAMGLRCDAGTCQPCSADAEGCPCMGGLCGDGLVCGDGDICRSPVACIEAGCVMFQLCTEVPGQDAFCEEACEAGYRWSGSVCEVLPTCEPDVPGSIASICADAQRACVTEQGIGVCGDCQVGLLEDEDGHCRPPLECSALSCALENRACLPAQPGMDASCGGCLPGYLEEAELCLRDTTPTCSEDPNAVNSLLEVCTAQNRACVDDGNGATCGGCFDGYVEDPQSESCLSLTDFTFCDAEDDCPAGNQACITLSPDHSPRCLPPPCPAGETWNQRNQRCSSLCNCTSEGLTGQVWPVTDQNGDCVCETRPGYFYNTAIGRREAEPCDADGDGWTRRSAFVHVTDNDTAVRLNARCDVRSIDRVTLINEFGQTRDITISELTQGIEASQTLYETNESDDEEETLERQDTPYGARRFKASELNPLTKACVSALADINDNGISDLREHQQNIPESQRAWMATFTRMGYFVELHTGWYAPPMDGGPHGQYMIAERSRCSGDFPLGYNPDDGPWWRSCSRRRDGGYEPLEPVGYDFARWNCDEPGTCPPLEPPGASMSVGQVPPHGLCEEGLSDLGDWRGMNHASQFKCVEIISDELQPEGAYQIRREELWRPPSNPTGVQHLNQCRLVACTDGDPACQESAQLGEGANPHEALLECVADVEEVIDGVPPASLLGVVGFVARRYRDYGRPDNYEGGCLDEWAEWPQLCPGYAVGEFQGIPYNAGTVGQSDERNFGRLTCGCGFNYGGPECDLGCSSEQLHYGGSNTPSADGVCADGYCIALPANGDEGGRSGAWICGDLAITGGLDTPGQAAFSSETPATLISDDGSSTGTVTIRGWMPTLGTDGQTLCQTTDGDGRCTTTGATIR